MIAQFETPYTMAPYTMALSDASIRNKLLSSCQNRSLMISSATIAVILVLFIGGLASIISPNPVFIICGISALSWSLVLSWYLSHECAHRLVFTKKFHNRLLGEILFCINGLLYFPFSDYCSEHIRHHIEKVDLIGVDLRASINASPRLVKTLLLDLEYVYIPIVFFYVKYYYVYQIIKSGDQREKTRACASAFFYLAFVLSVAALNPVSLCWLFIAVSIRIHVIRFIDAFQHSYEEVDVAAEKITKKSRNYEQHNTYSFPVARRFRLMNVFILNFGYHNVHHALPSCPWYRLQDLADATAEYQLSSSKQTGIPTYLPILPLIKQYHIHRVSRIMKPGQGAPHDGARKFDLGSFTGAFTDNILG